MAILNTKSNIRIVYKTTKIFLAIFTTLNYLKGIFTQGLFSFFVTIQPKKEKTHPCPSQEGIYSAYCLRKFFGVSNKVWHVPLLRGAGVCLFNINLFG